MKKSSLIFAALCTVITVSCQKSVLPVASPSISISVTADIAQFAVDTKTSIDGTATTIRPVWSADDEIKLFDSDGNSAIYIVSSGAGTSKASFTLKDGETALPGTFACAYYPAADTVSYDAVTGISAIIPPYQTYTANGSGVNSGTFANGSFPMVGTGTLNEGGTNLNLTFKNLFGLLQINLQDETAAIKRIDIVGSSALSGAAVITPHASAAETPTCTVSGNSYVTLISDSEVTLSASESKAFYIAVPEASLSKIYFTTSTGLYSKSFTSTSITRSRIMSMPAITVSSETKIIYPEKTDDIPPVAAGHVWAPVNCGYDATHTYGLMYQWGRKYGQGYDGETPAVVKTSASPALTVHPDLTDDNKNVFYKTEKTVNWYEGTDKEDLWGPTKTAYDPCPSGWRVPTYDEVNSLIGNTGNTPISGNFVDMVNTVGGVNQHGSWFDGTLGEPSTNIGVFIPAAGYRGPSGSNYGRGTDGYYWTSTPTTDSFSWFWNFNNTKTFMHAHGRSYGRYVRCISE